MRKYLTIHTPADGRRFRESGDWKDETLLDFLLRHVADRPGAVALVDADRSCTFAGMLDAVRRTAALLRDRGVGPGDPVMIQLRNCSTYAVANVAISALVMRSSGAKRVAVRPRATPMEAMALIASSWGWPAMSSKPRLPGSIGIPCSSRSRKRKRAIWPRRTNRLGE